MVTLESMLETKMELSAEMIEELFNLKPLPSLLEIEHQCREGEDRVMKDWLSSKCGVRKAVSNGEAAKIPL